MGEDLDQMNKTQKHLLDHNYTSTLKLENLGDLEKLRVMAEERDVWRGWVERMCQTGKVEAGLEDSSVDGPDGH